MKIIAPRLIVTIQGRNFVTLKIETDQGLYGIGDATLNGRELAVASIKGYSTRGIKFRACYSNQAVQFFAFKGEQQIWQGYYFVAAQVPETCRGSR